MLRSINVLNISGRFRKTLAKLVIDIFFSRMYAVDFGTRDTLETLQNNDRALNFNAPR